MKNYLTIKRNTSRLIPNHERRVNGRFMTARPRCR
jgi:hypothetical protein